MSSQTGRVSRRDFLRVGVLTAAGAILAACGGSAAAPTSAPAAGAAATKAPDQAAGAAAATKAPEQAAAAAPKGDPVTLRIHERTWNLKLDYWKALGDKFTQKNPNVKLTVHAEEAGDKYNERILTQLAGGTIGDLFWVVDVENYKLYSAKNVLTPLDPFIKKDNYQGEIDQFLKPVMDFFRKDGNLELIPTGMHNGPICFYYNKDLLAKAGVSEPTVDWTLDQLVDAAKKLNDPTNGVWGFGSSIPWSEMEIAYCRSFGGDILAKDGKTVTVLQEPAKKAYKFMYDLFNTYKVSPPPGALTDGDTPAFASGKMALHINGPWRGADIRLADKEGKVKWGMTLMPKGPAGRHAQRVAEGYPIPKSAKQPQWAWEFIKFMSSKEENVARPPLGFIPPVRKDAIFDPALMKDPDYALYAKDMVDNPSDAPTLPANNRVSEIYTLYGQETGNLWLGKVSLEEGLANLERQLKTIADKPNL